MAKYIRDYRVTFLVDKNTDNKLVYTSIDQKNPLHVTFSVGYDVGKPEAKLELSIYNMSPSSRKLLHSQDVKVLLETGTRDTSTEKIAMSTIFLGTVSEPLSTATANSDHVTKIKATNGYEIKGIQLFNSIEGKITKLKAIEHICNDIAAKSYGMINFDLSYLQEGGYSNATRDKLRQDLKEVYNDGYSYNGTADNCLRDILRDFNLESSMRSNGTIKIHKQNHTESNKVFQLRLDNGLLTIPQPVSNKTTQAAGDPRVAKGYSFKSLILPSVNVNDRIRVDHPAVEIKEDLIIQSIKFSGGYEASHWYSTIKANLDSVENPNKSIAQYSIVDENSTDYSKLLQGG